MSLAAGVVLLASMATGDGARSVAPAAAESGPTASVPPLDAASAVRPDIPSTRQIGNLVEAPAVTRTLAPARRSSPPRVTAKGGGKAANAPRSARRTRPDPVTTRFAGGARQIAWIPR
jgi:hypothetical protein